MGVVRKSIEGSNNTTSKRVPLESSEFPLSSLGINSIEFINLEITYQAKSCHTLLSRQLLPELLIQGVGLQLQQEFLSCGK